MSASSVRSRVAPASSLTPDVGPTSLAPLAMPQVGAAPVSARSWPSNDAWGISLVDPVAVDHQGNVVVIAREAAVATDRLYYNVRRQDVAGEDDALNWSGWYELNLAEQSGTAPVAPASTVGVEPLLRIGGATLVTVSPIARTSAAANAPFRVISDGQYVCIFRQSSGGTLYLNRFALVEAAAVADDEAEADEQGAVALVLQPVWETRYQRSGVRDAPAGPKDTLGSRDATGRAFIQPTLELATVGAVTQGRFAVVLAPSAMPDVRRWHFFSADAAGTVVARSFACAEDGLPDLGGTSATTFTITPTVVTDTGLTTMTCIGGVTAAMFAQQEPVGDGTGDVTAIRRTAHLMLCAPVANASIGLPSAAAVYDFAIQSDGTIAPFDGTAGSILIDGSIQGSTFTPLSGVPRYPVPASAVHTVGTSTVAAVVLGQVAPADGVAPQLTDGADGLLHCYYQGRAATTPTNAFLVAQFSPVCTRDALVVPWQAGAQSGQVQFVAASTGSTFDAMTMAITDHAGGTDVADLCDIAISYGIGTGIPSEQWTGVPRRLTRFLGVVRGEASADPQDCLVQSGVKPFFDYSGTRPIARLPLVASSAPPDPLLLVTRRNDVPLAGAVVATPIGTTTTLSVTFTVGSGSGSQTVTQSWPSLPTASDTAAAILRGAASSSTYAYAAGTSDTKVFGLATDAGLILLFAAAAAQSATVSLQVTGATNGNPASCDVVLAVGTTSPTTLANVPRAQAGLVTALRASPTFTTAFAHISPDPAEGATPNQAVMQHLTLRELSTLFGVVAPRPSGPLAAATVTTTLQGHTQTPPPVTGSIPQHLLALSVSALGLPATGAEAIVQNATAAVTEAAGNGAWLAAATLQSIAFNGSNAMTLPTGTTAAAGLAPGIGWTVEGWVKPASGAAASVVTYENGAAATPGGVARTYVLGTVGQESLAYGSFTPSGPFSGASVMVQPDPGFQFSGARTCEAWIKPSNPPGPTTPNALGCVFQVQDQSAPALYELGLDSSMRLVFAYRDESGDSQRHVTTTTLPAGSWAHVAVTLTPQSTAGTYQAQLWIGGEPQLAPAPTVTPWPPAEAPFFCIGANDIRNVSMFGSIAELRFWHWARSQAELRRTMYTALTGYEPGLYGYWTLTDAVTSGKMLNTAVATGATLDGICQPSQSQSMRNDNDGTFVGVVGGVGGQPVKMANAFLLSQHWHHLAMSFAAGTAVNLNGTPGATTVQFGKCRPSRAFDFSDAATLEAWINAPAGSGATPGIDAIVGKWGARLADQSYVLGLTDGGQLTATVILSLPDKSVRALTCTGNTVLKDGQSHHVAATYASSTTADGGNVTVTCTLTLYVDGRPHNAASTTYSGPVTSGTNVLIQRTSSVVCVGAATPAKVAGQTIAMETQGPFSGALTGVRLWDEALDAQGVQEAYALRQAYDSEGAIAAWCFAEQTGSVARDSIGDAHLGLTGTDYWVTFAALSEVSYYADGRPLLSLVEPPPNSTSGYGSGPAQFTLGASQTSTGLTLGFRGEMDDIRLWNVTRTREQLADGRYGVLRGDEYGLAAYWPLDGSTRDATGRGNDGVLSGTPAPTYQLSGAPIGNEGPWVRNVYGGTPTAFQESVAGAPAVCEYGDVQRAADGTLEAVMKRGYYFVNTSLALMPGFKVGELDLIHLGQVQTNPTLIGFIEGAPPVPSENLSRPLYLSPIAYTGYLGASAVTLTQTEATTLTVASSNTDGFVSNMAFGGGMFANIEKNLQVSPGPDVQPKVLKGDLKVGLKTSFALSSLETDATTLASSWTDTLSDSMALRGAWEPQGATASAYLNPLIGRRFVPDNEGYALVESLTADLYGMKSRRTGVVVGTVIVPDTQIPPDKNIITFRIDPRYTKNGTLDGKVGLVNDPDFPEADMHPGSYFRATEAYLLKARIERERAEIETAYEQFDARTRGKDKDTDLSAVEGSQTYDWSTGAARKSMVNSYVWTASGGLHREQEQIGAQRIKSYTGAYKLVHQYGLLVDGKLAAGLPAATALGGYWNVDLLFGRQVEVVVSKSRADAEGFGVDVVVAPDPMLLAWDPSLNGGAGGFTSEPCPGKVAAYRFMTFYLAPHRDNTTAFLDVVDPDWLRNSSDPNAVALRGARLSDNPVWRVLHRVTYVSRVPPAADDNPDLTVSVAPAQPIDVGGNQVLIRLVQQALGASPATPQNLGAAVAAVLDPPPDAQGAYPVSLLGAVVPWWETFLATTRGATPIAAAQALLYRVTRDAMTYMSTGYDTGVLPIT